MRWSASVGSTSSTYRFCSAGRRITCRPDADGGGLGPRGQRAVRRPRGRAVADTRQASRQPSSSWSGVKVRSSCRRDRDVPTPVVDPHLALVAGAVAAAGGVDGDAVPRRGVEDRDARRHPDRRGGAGAPVDREGQVDPAGAVVPARRRRAPTPRGECRARRALRGAGRRSRRRCGGRLGRAVPGDPGHAPLVVARSRSAALHRLDDLGVRASMIALVRPGGHRHRQERRVERVPAGHAEGDVGGAAGHVEARTVADAAHRLHGRRPRSWCRRRSASPAGR